MATTADQPRLPGIRKAAIVLAQMDPAHCALVLTQMDDAEIEQITAEISRLRDLDADEASDVLDELYVELVAHQNVGQGGPGFAREMLLATLGPERTDEMLARLAERGTASAFVFLQDADAGVVASLVADEHPQTIAVVLTYLETQKASAVLALFPTETQTEIAHRIAVMEPSHPEMVRALAAVLQHRFELLAEDDLLESAGGVTPLVEIMNFTDRETERLILNGIEFRNPDLAEEIRALLFVFEDIVQLEDRAAQLVLRNVETAELAMALKGAADEVRDKVMRNMSERAAENLADEIDLLGSVRLAAVQDARKAIVRQIRLLDESGEIAIQRGNVEESIA